MKNYLVIATIDGTQLIRMFLAWSVGDAQIRARYFWRESTINSLEVHETIIVDFPDNFEP